MRFGKLRGSGKLRLVGAQGCADFGPLEGKEAPLIARAQGEGGFRVLYRKAFLRGISAQSEDDEFLAGEG